MVSKTIVLGSSPSSSVTVSKLFYKFNIPDFINKFFTCVLGFAPFKIQEYIFSWFRINFLVPLGLVGRVYLPTVSNL